MRHKRHILSFSARQDAENLYQSHIGFIQNYSRTLTGGSSDPEDLVQDTLIRIMEHMDTLLSMPVGKQTAYIALIMKSLYINQRKKAHARLEECKEQIYSIFQKPDLSAPLDSLRFGVLIQDETYLRSLGEIQSNLSMLRILLPILIVLVGSTGFLAGYLTTRGRLREFAVMRCLGIKRRSIFAQIFCEQALLGMLGGLTGRAAGAALEHNVEPAALAKAAIMVGVFLSGTALATARITRVNVMKLMKAED